MNKKIKENSWKKLNKIIKTKQNKTHRLARMRKDIRIRAAK